MSEGLGVLLFVVALLAVVLIHEAGHFFSAKGFGIKVEEFFVGFGPRLWSVRRGETEYGVKALPLGGYVRIAGMNPFQEPSPEDRPRTFGAKPIWQRAVVILAGPLTHFVMALVFLAVFFMAIGVENQARPRIDAVEATLEGRPSPAARVGLRAGDEIVAVDGRPVGTVEGFIRFTRSSVGEPVSITVRRGDRELTVEVTPVLAVVGRERVGRIGILLGAVRERSGPLTALGRAGVATWQVARGVVLRLGDVFGPQGIQRVGEALFGTRERTIEDPTGIVGASRLAGQAVAAGAWGALLELLVVFNVFVGVINLAPLPPLDGGHLAILAYEKVTRRAPDLRKLVPLTALVVSFLVLFVLAITYLDIVKPIPSPFR